MGGFWSDDVQSIVQDAEVGGSTKEAVNGAKACASKSGEAPECCRQGSCTQGPGSDALPTEGYDSRGLACHLSLSA
jgi:hypothetical protein